MMGPADIAACPGVFVKNIFDIFCSCGFGGTLNLCRYFEKCDGQASLSTALRGTLSSIVRCLGYSYLTKSKVFNPEGLN